MKHIFIIRHGETDNNKTQVLQGRAINASINDRGKIQAQAIADGLANYPIEKIVTSSLIRTLETARPLVNQTKAMVESYPELDEMSFGEWEGCFFADVKGKIHEVQQEWLEGNIGKEIPKGESPQQVFDRAGTKLIEVLEKSTEEYIAFFVHGRLIRILLSGILGKGLENMHHIEHQNGSINHLTWNGDGFEVVELNKLDHLNYIEAELS